MPGGRPPAYPAGHPLASNHIRRKYGELTGPEPGELIAIIGDKVEFQAFVSPSQMKIIDTTLEIALTVIGTHVDDALPLRHLVGQAFPLKVTIEVWPDARRQIEEGAALLGPVDG